MSLTVYLVALVLLVASHFSSQSDAHGIKVTDLQTYMTHGQNTQRGHMNEGPSQHSLPEPLEDVENDSPADADNHARQSTQSERGPPNTSQATRPDPNTITSQPHQDHPQTPPPASMSHEMITNKAHGLGAQNASLSTPARGPKSASQVEREEEKLRNATVKLVMWLRNRLRKRLEEVATLEHDLDTEKIVLQNLQVNITNTTAAREDEIRLKIHNQKRLAAFRRHVEEPEKQLLLIQSQTKKLSDKLAHLGEVYNTLAKKHRAIREKLHAAGLSHWLETRGREYMPATAVGVLSKSVELFEPLSEGFEKALELDDKLAREVEGVVPLARTTLIVEVLEDMVMLLPMIPVLLVMCRLLQKIHQLSVLHVVMYFATAFCTEAVLLLFASLCLGREPLRAMQQSHETLLIAGILINLVLYVVYILTQCLIAVLKTSRFEVLQTVLGLAVGYHCYQTVFKPAMLNEPVTASEMSYVMYILNFCLVIYEKKSVLNIDIPYESEINDLLLSVESWFWETVEAMSNVFREKRAEVDMYSDSATSELCFSEYTAITESAAKRGIDEMKTKETEGRDKEARTDESVLPLRGRRNYNQWSGARIMTSARVYHSNMVDVMKQTTAPRGSQVAGVRGIVRAVGQGHEKGQAVLSGSKSDGSSVYGSCRE